MGYRLNRLDEAVFVTVSKPMQTEFGIHHWLESCVRLLLVTAAAHTLHVCHLWGCFCINVFSETYAMQCNQDTIIIFCKISDPVKNMPGIMPLQNNLWSGLCYDFSLCLRTCAIRMYTYIRWLGGWGVWRKKGMLCSRNENITWQKVKLPMLGISTHRSTVCCT